MYFTNVGEFCSQLIIIVIEAGVDPNEPDRRGAKPVFLAISTNSLTVLAEGGADLTVVDSDENTLLHHYCGYLVL